MRASSCEKRYVLEGVIQSTQKCLAKPHDSLVKVSPLSSRLVARKMESRDIGNRSAMGMSEGEQMHVSARD